MIKILDLRFLDSSETIGAFLLETSAGPVLFETGPHSTYATLSAELAKYNYTPEDVKHVFVTHIHLDHAGAAWAFAEKGAMIYMHPFGEKHLADPSKLLESARRIYKDKMDMLWGQLHPIAKTQIHTVEHSEEITVGDQTIKAWYTPGHAVHHVAWQIGGSLIGGDVTGVKINDGMIVPPCPPPDINVEDWLASIRLIRDLPLTEIYLTHFGRVTDIKAHLEKLEYILLDWAAWMKPHFDNEADPKMVTPKFQEYVAGQLAEAGLDKADIQRYEKANPPWMSVFGLMRYWKKAEERKNA